MTGFVLVLAGLTCGDGGPGMGEAREPLAVGVRGAWQGRWDARWDGTSVWGHAKLRDGLLQIEGRASGRAVTYRVHLEGPSTLRVTLLEGPRHIGSVAGIFKEEGGRLLISLGEPCPTSFKGGSESARITLYPAAVRKP